MPKRTGVKSRKKRSAPRPTLTLVPVERVERSILLIRKEKVMLDADLAVLYGVSTKRLNEQVRRNRDRFPPDFLIELTGEEKAEVVANCDHLARLKYSPALPLAFTEHGAIMAANVLSSPYSSNQPVRRWMPSLNLSGSGSRERTRKSSVAKSKK